MTHHERAPGIDDTHDPNLQSWVETANDPDTDFPLQNLPWCRVSVQHDDHTHDHVGVAIGDQILDFSMLVEAGEFEQHDEDGLFETIVAYADPTIASHVPHGMQRIRAALIAYLSVANPPGGQQSRRLRAKALHPIADATLLPAVNTANYTDFYASIHHATNVGSMFRPDNPLLPNYKHIPIGYHGRASSIVASGAPIRRPHGQLPPPDDNQAAGPTFGPCKMLDYELELGAIIGRGNSLGQPIPIHQADEHIFGLCIVNDWSARDIQKWEYQPLGPFLAKNFATTVSPFIVTREALAPFRCAAHHRAASDPKPLPYLMHEPSARWAGFDITVEASLQSEQMRQRNINPVRISRGSFKDMYWTFAQMIAHHASNGCNLEAEDLIASGTISGPTRQSRGCMLELTWDGDPWASPPTIVPGSARTPLKLPTGEDRRFLADGDEVILKAFCERAGFRRIGFGECRGRVTPAS